MGKSKKRELSMSPVGDVGAAFLLPEAVDAATTLVLRALVRESVPDNTRASLHSAVRYWQAWHLARFGAPLPLPQDSVPVATVLTYIADHAVLKPSPGRPAYSMPAEVERKLLASGAKRRNGPPKYGTWSQRLAMLSIAHRSLGLENPCRQPAVQDLVRMAKEPAAKQNLLNKKRPPAIREVIEAMLSTCDDTVAGRRDRALLLFAFASGGRRRSEIANAVFEQLEQRVEDEGGAIYYLYRLTGAKRQAADEDRPKPIRGRAAVALEAWIDALAGARVPLSGAIFRPVRGTKKVWIGPHLSGHAVNDIFKGRATMAGLSPELTAHSLRGGFMTQAHRDGINILDAMALSDHRDIKTVKEHYHTDIDAEKNPAGKLMG